MAHLLERCISYISYGNALIWLTKVYIRLRLELLIVTIVSVVTGTIPLFHVDSMYIYVTLCSSVVEVHTGVYTYVGLLFV